MCAERNMHETCNTKSKASFRFKIRPIFGLLALSCVWVDVLLLRRSLRLHRCIYIQRAEGYIKSLEIFQGAMLSLSLSSWSLHLKPAFAHSFSDALRVKRWHYVHILLRSRIHDFTPSDVQQCPLFPRAPGICSPIYLPAERGIPDQ